MIGRIHIYVERHSTLDYRCNLSGTKAPELPGKEQSIDQACLNS
jgi:hypothetical protein